ncbi:hypothetical protein [Mycobacterium asiaticum]|uniref:Uncharacterized protein n=1 Tax=Mycobacterium asiaticum TaxID=1790 RepID=A0A1A3MZ57_MYCAS|nr:hypothetical protein [Mycobacterium asiaticum]OBK14089.1 hypothetical protein A5635_10365 [Mycobacterium asiaticum]
MARDAVWKLLNTDATLKQLAGDDFVAVPQFSGDQAPAADVFIVICWRHTDFNEDIQQNAERHFDLYAHIRKRKSTDFGRIDALFDQCDEIFKAVEDATDAVVGDDGWRLDYVGFEGRGMDFEDEGYQSICKSASYMALASKVIAP